jgi:lipopolysaccharide/colanic/teichoic acid biosynthesis glycosyltransferase
MLKRLFDIILSGLGLAFLLPFFLIISICIVIDSKGGAFFLQTRVGKKAKPFKLFKFRTMSLESDAYGLITIGSRDPRVTKVGYFLRKYKIDELPQLLNVFLGSMSLVGPRPEVAKYVNMYSEEQKKVLSVKPGITDYASLDYFSENELLAKSNDPDKTYIEEILPSKLKLNLKYIREAGFMTDLRVILKTLQKIISH